MPAVAISEPSPSDFVDISTCESPGCSGTLVRDLNDEVYCPECGLVAAYQTAVSLPGRVDSSDGPRQGVSEGVRTTAEPYWRHGPNTNIGYAARGSGPLRRIVRMRHYDARFNRHPTWKGNAQVAMDVDRFASLLQIPTGIRNDAKNIAFDVRREKLGYTHEVLAFAALVLASRRAGVPMLVRKDAKRAGVRAPHVFSLVRTLQAEHNIEAPHFTAVRYLEVRSSHLVPPPPREAVGLAKEILETLASHQSNNNHMPAALAGAALYVASVTVFLEGTGRDAVSQSSISMAFGVTEVTVRNGRDTILHQLPAVAPDLYHRLVRKRVVRSMGSVGP